MADSWQGPGRRPATDGRPPPPGRGPGGAPAGPPGLSPTLSAWAQGLLWVVAAAAALTALAAPVALVAFEGLVRRPTGATYDGWVLADDVLAVAAGTTLLCLLAALVLLVIWAHRAHRAAGALGPVGRRWTSGWAVVAWVVPVANLVLPKLVLDETDRISRAPRPPGGVGVGWRFTSRTPSGSVWWGLSLLFVALNVAASLLLPDGPVEVERTRVDAFYVVMALAYVAAALAATAGASYVRAVSRRLSPAALAGSGE